MDLATRLNQYNRLARWDIRPIDAWLFVCLVLIGASLLSGVFVNGYYFFSGAEKDLESLPYIIASGMGLQLSGLLAWYLFKQFTQYSSRNNPATAMRSIQIGAIGFVCAYLLLIPSMLVWRFLLDLFNFEYEFQLPVLLVQNGGTTTEMALLALLVVIVAPVCEELVYRGFLFRYFNERLPLAAAIAIPSAIFALMHFNLYSFFPLFILGAALCVVYKITGNILSSITLHGLFNLLNLLLIYSIEPIEL